MAGAIAEGVIVKLTEMIVQQAAQEAELVCNFTKDFEWLKNTLKTVSGGLKYVDALFTQDEDIKAWLDKVRDFVWDAEDIVGECAVRSLNARSVTQFCVCSPHEMLFRYRIGKKIHAVKERISSIERDGKQLKLFRDLVQPSKSAAGREVWKGNSLPPKDSHPVAIESKLQHLISLIDESTVSVIAVVGMGGAGKTFLLQNVFDRIKQRYDHSIWFSISQSYSVHKLQCDLTSHMGDLEVRVKDVSDERAAELIHADLLGTKSLIVLDDVWSATREVNIVTSLGLPIGHESQCKVVVTTRSKEVCQNLGAFLYQMELLSEQESWKLFCTHAFRVNRSFCLGFTEISQWSSKLRQLVKVVDVNTDPVIQILRLSYDSLPTALKPCFSYLSFFPEDEKIDCEYLINRWIAEGFIPHVEEQWDVAWGYLYQLANVCLLEVWEDDNLIRYCKIHDLLLDLSVDISKENRCAFAVEDSFTSVKRILLGRKELDDGAIAQSRASCTRASCTRALRTLSLYKNPIEKIEASFFRPMRLLRVLDLSETNISTLTHCVGKLKLLKVLNLSRTRIAEVPICVRSLKSLVLLDLSMCQQLRRLPDWIGELKCLEHLNIIAWHDELRSHMPKGISELVSLRVLRSDSLWLSVEEDGLLKLDDVAILTRLQELCLTIRHEEELRSIEDGILRHLVNMSRMSVSGFSTESHLPQNITALKDLHTLELRKFAVPNWMCKLTNLRQLILWDCKGENYPPLETLPNLVRLALYGNVSCRELPEDFGKTSGFPNLRFLTISGFPLLEKLPDFEDGAMPVMENFRLVLCPRMKKVPQGLERLRRLREFYYRGTGTDEFRERLNEGGEVWIKMKEKNPYVRIRRGLIFS
ncbi:hypothetical protein SUGI_0356700 [Cryptomeria japonica]|nr:hypothetical protein SUGI_0356700 [Cryptomeria japonica]